MNYYLGAMCNEKDAREWHGLIYLFRCLWYYDPSAGSAFILNPVISTLQCCPRHPHKARHLWLSSAAPSRPYCLR